MRIYTVRYSSAYIILSCIYSHIWIINAVLWAVAYSAIALNSAEKPLGPLWGGVLGFHEYLLIFAFCEA